MFEGENKIFLSVWSQLNLLLYRVWWVMEAVLGLTPIKVLVHPISRKVDAVYVSVHGRQHVHYLFVNALPPLRLIVWAGRCGARRYSCFILIVSHESLDCVVCSFHESGIQYTFLVIIVLPVIGRKGMKDSAHLVLQINVLT